MSRREMTEGERAAAIAKILARAHPPNERGCREWKTSTPEANGYPTITINCTTRNAHAWMWALHFGHPSNRAPVMHKCDNRMCVSIEHLELGTQSENARSMWRNGLRKRRDQWCDSSVRLMLHLYLVNGMAYSAIAKLFGTTPNTVYRIVTFRSRASVSAWPPFDAPEAQ